MGMEMCMMLERKVGSKMDSRTSRTRLMVMLCATGDACPLPKAVMETIARFLLPEGAAEWAPCKFNEHILAKPERWAELRAAFVQEEEEVKAAQESLLDEDEYYDFLTNELEHVVGERLGLTWEDSLSPFSDRGYIHHLVNSESWAWVDTTGRPTQLSCMIRGLPADITDDRRRDEYLWDNHPHGPGEGRHCHCYLDGLFAVDWDEDKDSAFRSGFAPATDVIEHVKLMPNRSMFNWTEPTKEEMEKYREEFSSWQSKNLINEADILKANARKLRWENVHAQLGALRSGEPSNEVLLPTEAVGEEDTSEAALAASMAIMCARGLAAAERDFNHHSREKHKLDWEKRMLEHFQTVIKTRHVEAQPEVVVRLPIAARPDDWVATQYNSVAGGKRMSRKKYAGSRVPKGVAKFKSKLVAAGVPFSDFRCVFYFC